MKIFKNHSKTPEEVLYRSFDARLTPSEKVALEKALAQSADLRKKQKSIAQLRQAIKQNAVQAFTPFFADRVMQQIYTISRVTEDFFTSLLWSFRRVAIPGLACLILLVGHNFMRKGKISAETFLSRPQLSLEETWPIEDLLEGDIE
jgi:hypothetical protein